MKYTEDVVLDTGSIIHWSKPRIIKSNNYLICITCGSCNKTRYVQISKGVHRATYSGYCLPCKNREIASRHTGSNGQNWKGGRVPDRDGYIYVHISLLSPEEQVLFKTMYTDRGYIAEHRLVIARHLNRPLLKNEVVHHLNEIKADNRLENLVLTSKSGHSSIHNSILKAARIEILRLQKLLKKHHILY